MSAPWDFLSNAENREVLAWIGGGACVVISGLWAAIKHYGAPAEPSSPQPEPRPQRQVTGGDGLVAGGNVSVGGDVRIGDVALPRLAMALAAFGMALLALAAIFGGGDTTTGSVVSGGDINAPVTIDGTPPMPER